LGYINVPYCHGMTVGELARFFNEEYKIRCNLHVIPMKGWKRHMTYQNTGLAWIPTSPYIPEPDTPFFYASTGILGSLGIVNIGIGYTLPFKVVGAPWIDADDFAAKLNAQKLPGVKFLPFHYQPYYGKFKGKHCEGVQIIITDPHRYRPLAVQYMLIGLLKSLYPSIFRESLAKIDQNSHKESSKNNPKTPIAIPTLSIERGSGEDQAAYANALVACLKRNLVLPEVGEVKIELMLQSSGSLKGFRVLSSQSERNKRFLETELGKIRYPSFTGSLKSEKEHPFVITFSNH